jgi:peptidoglycan hydrolase-like protein with peptidoglycan-binding domain
MGSKGPEVEALQKKLGITVDGAYGTGTRDAVIALQKQLGVTADGAYGPATKAAHDKSGQGGMASTPVNVAPAGQPQATAPDQAAGTIRGATQAIPTTPVNPANPGGVSSQMTMTPAQAQATLDNGSERDIQAFGGKEKLQQIASTASAPQPAAAPAQTAPAQTAPATAQPGQTAAGAVTARPVRPATGARATAIQNQQAQNQVPESVGYDEVQRIVSLVHYR